MDELDLLKKDWQKTSYVDNKQLTSVDIYPMLHKKSSSIVKTLFYISIAELVFWVILNTIPYFASDEYRAELETMFHGSTWILIFTIFSYAVILLFVYLLFKSYKDISVTDNVRKLMKNILKTRKVIKYYVLYNLIMAFLSISYGMYESATNDPEVSAQFAEFSDKQMFVAMLFMIVGAGLFIGLIWIFYRLIYGILLKKLNRNYNELKKLEV
ncbi:MAG: hypothetical protein AAF688_02095 [Bacteroidota bacterium]